MTGLVTGGVTTAVLINVFKRFISFLTRLPLTHRYICTYQSLSVTDIQSSMFITCFFVLYLTIPLLGQTQSSCQYQEHSKQGCNIPILC